MKSILQVVILDLCNSVETANKLQVCSEIDDMQSRLQRVCILALGRLGSNRELVSATVFGICLISPCKTDSGLERKVGDKVVGGRLVEMSPG